MPPVALTTIESSTTTTLFLQRKDDERCPKCQAEELFVSLYRAGDTPTERGLDPCCSDAVAAPADVQAARRREPDRPRADRDRARVRRRPIAAPARRTRSRPCAQLARAERRRDRGLEPALFKRHDLPLSTVAAATMVVAVGACVAEAKKADGVSTASGVPLIG